MGISRQYLTELLAELEASELERRFFKLDRRAMLELADVCLRPGQGSEVEAGVFEHSFAPGDITVVLGANQSGKTDLCRLVAGLNTRARGTVLLDGVELTGVPMGLFDGELILCDEVQPGFGRLGSHWWGHQALGFAPDVVTLGKPMANGHPVAATITDRRRRRDRYA